MKKIEISINPLAEYLEATEARRIKILEEQQKPDTNKARHYQLAKARIKKSVELSGSHKPITEAIKILKERKPKNDRKKNDIVNSIIALEKYKEMALHKLVKENKLELITPKQKYLNFNGITITVSPNIIFRLTINGEKRIGACKIHISKAKAFSNRQSKLVANILEQYLSNCVVAEDELVDPALCFCLDPFSGTTINSNSLVSLDMKQIKDICMDIKNKYDSGVGGQKVA